MHQQVPSPKKARRWVGAGAAIVVVGVGALLLFPRSAPPPPAPKPAPVASTPPREEHRAPTFVRFETPTPKVRIHPIGEGFEVINTDPSLTGTQMDFAGITDKGTKIPYSVKLPPPVQNAQPSGG
jgi:hypothetical protein